MSRQPAPTFKARRRAGASVTRKLAALIDHAMDGRAIELADDVAEPLRRICADRLARLADEPADVIAVVDIIVSETGLPAPDEALALTDALLSGGYPPFFRAWLETLVGTLAIDRQSSFFALAVAVWSISEAKCGPVNVRSDYTPGIGRVIENVELLIADDFKDKNALTRLISDALRNNPHIWQIKGRLRREWSGE